MDGIPDGYIKVNHDETEAFRHSLNEWIAQTNTGYVLVSYEKQLTSEDAATISKIDINITEFGAKSVPSFIMGTQDPYDDAKWDAFKKAISKYDPDKATQIYQKVLNQMNQ